MSLKKREVQEMQIEELLIIAIVFILGWFITAFTFWLAGRAVSGIKATFSDALIVSFVGNIVSSLFYLGFETFLLPTFLIYFTPILAETVAILVSAIISILVYIPLIMRFFDTGLGGAILIGILIIFIWIFIAFLLFVIFFPFLLAIFTMFSP
jgi:hypothetical protein